MFFIAVLSKKPADYRYMPNDWETNPDVDDQSLPDFSRMPMLMLVLITLLNDGTQISIGYDHAVPSKYPNAWNLRAVFTIASVLASVALLSSLLILLLCIDSWRDGSFFQQTCLGGLSYGQITTVVYLKNSISDFSARNHEGFFNSISKCKFDCS